MRIRGLVVCALVSAMAVTSTGCSSIEPWVKPYDRQNLADPIMEFNRSEISSEFLEHVHGVREGSRGATGSAGGGCGCN